MQEADPHEVRRIVIWGFRHLGMPPSVLFDLEENAVVRDSCCTARTYCTEGLMAMWLTEIGILQFYDAEGQMLMTVNLSETINRRKASA